MTTSPSEPLLETTTHLSPDGQTPAAIDETRVPSRAGIVLRRFLHHKVGVLGLVVIVLLVLVAYLGPIVDRWSYTQLDFNNFLTKPSGLHWFGTDEIGHDMFAATMRGAQKSIQIGLLVALFATGVAAVVGAAAGYFGGWTDRVLMWIVDLLLVVPAFLIIAVLSGQFASNWLLFVLLLGMFIWQITARIVRGQTLSLKEREYVSAARYMGVSGWRIIGRHILPNLSSLLIIDATVNVSAAILLEAGLSFFGFGVQPPDVSLGTLLSDNQQAAFTSPWLFYFPAGFLILLVLAVNLAGDGLRDALDPTSGRAQ
ncbi:MAG TPA: ABC transporter permease [Mycobacteriales bacterium]|nr:ABC transporter permease [Mycobacteriales bacterium]